MIASSVELKEIYVDFFYSEHDEKLHHIRYFLFFKS